MSKIHGGEQKRLLTFIWNTETNKHKCPKISEMMFRDIDNVISIMERTIVRLIIYFHVYLCLFDPNSQYGHYRYMDSYT